MRPRTALLIELLLPMRPVRPPACLQVARNVTTNELANWHRYKYLQGPDGRGYANPFSRGLKENCKEACLPGRVAMAPVYLSREVLAASAVKHGCGSGGCRSCKN